MPSLSNALRREYEELFGTCRIRAERAAEVEAAVQGVLPGRPSYELLQASVGVPWWVTGAIHSLESTCNFNCHLHNGDSLSGPTTRHPPGRPKGPGPFTWEVSATDALGMRGLGDKTDWSLAGTLFQLERYNGFGYRDWHPHVRSPYLWSTSEHYTRGKYVKDGVWSDTAVSQQIGAAVLLRRMVELGLFEFPDQPLPAAGALPLVPAYATVKPTDPAEVRSAEALQLWLNTFPGIFLKVDGFPGKRTSEAYRRVTGSYLPGDPRG